MKNLILTAALFLGVAAIAAQAQSMKATIPFGFEANGKMMPAGEYTLAHTSALNGGVYAMRSMDLRASTLLAGVEPITNSDGRMKLVFDRGAEGYYLSEVWDGSVAHTIRRPRGRNSILASTKPATRVVVPAHR